MNNNQYRAPKYDAGAFTCPHCGAIGVMRWEELFSKDCESLLLERAICDACNDYSIWRIETDENGYERNGHLIYPDKQTAPLPNEDLSKDCRKDYMEAREIQFKSPRGAAALLRLCIQKVCVELDAKGDNLDRQIESLVLNGLPTEIQQALDIVRVVGNNAVHPGELSIEEKPEIVSNLFDLVNEVIEDRISRPNRLRSLYNDLPNRAKQKIDDRNKKARGGREE